MDAASDDGRAVGAAGPVRSSVALLVAAVLATRPDLGAARPHAGRDRRDRLLDLGANALFALATTEGLVSVASVCSSLYPVVTILLARAVLSASACAPRSRRGVALVMLGVVGIASG